MEATDVDVSRHCSDFFLALTKLLDGISKPNFFVVGLLLDMTLHHHGEVVNLTSLLEIRKSYLISLKSVSVLLKQFIEMTLPP